MWIHQSRSLSTVDFDNQARSTFRAQTRNSFLWRKEEENKMSRANLRSSHGRSFSANRTQSSQTTIAPNSKYPEIKQRGYYSDVIPPETEPTLGVRPSSSLWSKNTHDFPIWTYRGNQTSRSTVVLFQNVKRGPPTQQDTAWNVAKEMHTPMGSSSKLWSSKKLVSSIWEDILLNSTAISKVPWWLIQVVVGKLEVFFFSRGSQMESCVSCGRCHLPPDPGLPPPLRPRRDTIRWQGAGAVFALSVRLLSVSVTTFSVPDDFSDQIKKNRHGPTTAITAISVSFGAVPKRNTPSKWILGRVAESGAAFTSHAVVVVVVGVDTPIPLSLAAQPRPCQSLLVVLFLSPSWLVIFLGW